MTPYPLDTKETIVITIESGNLCSISKNTFPYIKSSITVSDIIMLNQKIGGRIVKKKKKVYKTLTAFKTRDKYYFYRGHLPRVITDLKKFNMSYKLSGKTNKLETTTPAIQGITFREEQLKLINKALKYKRGVIHAATGIGKSIIAAGVMSAYPNAKCLVIAHLSDLLIQLKENFEKFFDEEVAQLTSNTPESNTRISVVSIQTLSRMDEKIYANRYDLIIIDESHRVSSFFAPKKKGEDKKYSMYAKVLSHISTPYRLGFTATLPYTNMSKMAQEGLIGGVIGELSLNEAADLNILAKPKIKIIKSEYDYEIEEIKNYRKAYRAGIVDNIHRNKQVIDLVKELWEKEKQTTLILVTMNDHGHALVREAENQDLRIPFVFQSVKKEKRQQIKDDLLSKRVPAVCAGAAWLEGIDLPNISQVINAAGGKSEIRCLQGIGRGLRKTEDKDEVIIVDFFDPSSTYFIAHFGFRLSLYFKNNWM